jgi:uncharacterized protein YecE (DUF72 family)
MKACADYSIGLPAWAFPGWKDRYFRTRPSALASYADVFDTVEGNTTFYRVPDEATIARWHEAVAGSDFRFCFKLPREVTHEARPDSGTLEKFLAVIEPLGDHLGPLLVQFPADVGPGELEHFEPVFARLHGARRFVIEVRHPAFFTDPGLLEPTLERYGAGRVILDSRPLFEGDRSHPEILSALHQKPDVPVLPATCNGVTLVRLILHPDIVSNAPYIEEWAGRVADYLRNDVRTYMMIHCPNNLHCPPLAAEFHEALRQAASDIDIPALAPWPVPQQQDLLSADPLR